MSSFQEFFSITRAEASLPSSPSHTSKILSPSVIRFFASWTACARACVAYHFPRSVGKIPYPICPPKFLRYSVQILWRISTQPIISLSFITKNKVDETNPSGGFWRKFCVCIKNSSKFRPTKRAHGLISEIFSCSFQIFNIVSYAHLCWWFGISKWIIMWIITKQKSTKKSVLRFSILKGATESVAQFYFFTKCRDFGGF